MKKFKLKEVIKAEIKSILSEGQMTTDDAFKTLRDIHLNLPKEMSPEWKYYAELMGRAIDALQAAEVSRMMDRERGLNESLNPEVTTALNRFIKAMAKRYDYEEQDAVYAIMAALEQRKSDTKYDMPGFGDTMDMLKDESVNEAKYRVEFTTQDGEKAKSRVYNSEEEADKKEADLVNSGIKQAKVVKVNESVNEDRKAKEYIQSIEDPEEREAERKRMFGDDDEDLNENEISDLDKVKAEIKKYLAMYQDAEGDMAKKSAVEMLKKLNVEKKRLEAEEIEIASSIGRDQELDYDV